MGVGLRLGCILLLQTLLKTEILKNHLQIATISQAHAQSPTMSTTTSLILEGLNSNSSVQQGEVNLSALSPNPAV